MSQADSAPSDLNEGTEREQRSSGFLSSEPAPAGPTSTASPTERVQSPASADGVPAQPADSNELPLAANIAISTANSDFDLQTAGYLTHPLKVLMGQRDSALTLLTEERAAMRELETTLAAEQERALVAMGEQHEDDLRDLKNLLMSKEQALTAALTAERSRPPQGATMEPVDTLQRQSEEAQAQLQSAFEEIEETRVEAVRLQGERDDAIRATDDVRLELTSEVESARQEVEDARGQLEDIRRLWEDDQERAQAESTRALEELSENQVAASEKDHEIRSLRSGMLTELGQAKGEIQRLGSQLSNAKRELTRVLQELATLRDARDPAPLPHNPFAGR